MATQRRAEVPVRTESTALPAVDERVTLRADRGDGPWIKTWVVASSPEAIVLTRPETQLRGRSGLLRTPLPPVGRNLVASWVQAPYYWVLEVVVAAPSRPLPRDGAFVVMPGGPAERVQQREFLRAPLDGDVLVNIDGDLRTVEGIDVSEAGLRFRLPANAEVSEGTRVSCEVVVRGAWVSAVGRVLRLTRRPDATMVAVRFERLPAASEKALRAYAMDRQLRQLR